MWVFEGTYTGEAKEYIQEKKKKASKIEAWVCSIAIAFLFGGMAIFLSDGDSVLSIIIVCLGVGLIGFINLLFYVHYKREPKIKIEILNDGFKVYPNGLSYSFAFYKIEPMEFYDDFIVVQGKVVLQKELLVDGDWEELKSFLKKVQDSLDSDEPIYQIEEPQTEFWKATVKDKRVYEKFVEGVSWATPVGVFQYFTTFLLENNQEIEYEIGKELYEKMEKGQKGTLVIVGGNFFAFGDGEEVE